jgi:predicted HTH transcriptional regulator
MRPPAEWSEKDLLELIKVKAEEGPQLEFKAADSLDSSDKKKTEISKDVSAFANSAGGTVCMESLNQSNSHVAPNQ